MSDKKRKTAADQDHASLIQAMDRTMEKLDEKEREHAKETRRNAIGPLVQLLDSIGFERAVSFLSRVSKYNQTDYGDEEDKIMRTQLEEGSDEDGEDDEEEGDENHAEEETTE